MRSPMERLERLLRNRESFTLCFLIYEGSADRARTSARLARHVRAREIVHMAGQGPASTKAVIERIRGTGARTPVQVMGADLWPEGLEKLAYRLNLGRPLLAEHCPRPILMWVRDEEVATFKRKGPDFFSFASSVFDLRPGRADSREPDETGERDGGDDEEGPVTVLERPVPVPGGVPR